MKFLLGTKMGMTQIFDSEGRAQPVTVIAVPEIKVTQVKTVDKDGYAAIQVGYGVQKEFRIPKPQRSKGNFRGLKEFAQEIGAEAPAVGTAVDMTNFKEGDHVAVSAVSKGKGFAGVVKRYGFKGGPRSHGQKHSERERGSSGGGPGRAGGRVVKGMRMAGRMGSDRVTVKNLTLLKVDAEKAELYVRGAVPGRRGTLVEIRGQEK